METESGKYKTNTMSKKDFNSSLKNLKKGNNFMFSTKMAEYKVQRIFRNTLYYYNLSNFAHFTISLNQYADIPIILTVK